MQTDNPIETEGEETDPEPGPPRSLGGRALDALTAPSRLGDELRERPSWFWMGALGLAFALVGTAVIPSDVFLANFEAQMIASGQEVPEGGLISGGLFKAVALGSVSIFWFVMMAATAGVLALIFTFVLGGEGRYRQYLSATSHAFLISAIGALLVAPIRIATRDPQQTLGVGTFLRPLLDDGYLLRFATGLDFFALWSWAVLGILVSRFDRGTSAGLAATLTLSLLIGLIAIGAAFGG